MSNLKDILVLTQKICKDCPKELDPVELYFLELSLRRKERLGVATWYPLTRDHLARLVYSVEYERELNSKLNSISHGWGSDGAVRKARNEVKRKYADRMGKILSIINPALGDEWKNTLLAMKHVSAMQLEKLNMIAISAASNEKKLFWLKLLDSLPYRKRQYRLPKSNQDFRRWLAREVLYDMIEECTVKILDDLVESNKNEMPLVIPNTESIRCYFETLKFERRQHLYSSLRKRGTAAKAKQGSETPDESLITAAGQRLVYRFLMHLKGERIIHDLPSHCKSWIDRSNKKECMYPESIKDLTPLEIATCPWWIDMPEDEILEREKNLHKKLIERRCQR